MSQKRRRVFGPLFRTTIGIAVLLTAYVQLVTNWPLITERLQERSLSRSLRADDSREREAAAAALVRTDSKAAMPYLLEAAHDSRGELRALACRYLIEAGAEPNVVIPILVAAAGDVKDEVRHEAAIAFGRLPSLRGLLGSQLGVTPFKEVTGDLREASIKALRRLLKDTSSSTRVAAADALAQFGSGPEAVADLIAATTDSTREVRFAAARALLKVSGPNDRSAARTLVALAADPEPVADRHAVFDVVMSADVEIQDQMVAALTRIVADIDFPIHGDVVDLLVACGPRARAALPALEKLLNDEGPVERAIAGIAIATIEGNTSPRSIPILLRMIDDLAIAPESRASALEKIRELDEMMLVKATPILVRQLGSRSMLVRSAALHMLASIIEQTPAEMPAPNTAN